jgi:uncharacterized metal-binding protein
LSAETLLEEVIMAEEKACCCGKIQYNLVFACSGAADVGAVADQAARKLSRDKTAAVCCTAAIAAEIPEILERTTFATKTAVIDGCDKACAKKIMDKGGFAGYAYLELGTLGMEKGKTPANDANIARAADAAAEALNESGDA